MPRKKTGSLFRGSRETSGRSISDKRFFKAQIIYLLPFFFLDSPFGESTALAFGASLLFFFLYSS